MHDVREKCDVCGAPSDVGAHGIKDGEINSEYLCYECHYQLKRNGWDYEKAKAKKGCS